MCQVLDDQLPSDGSSPDVAGEMIPDGFVGRRRGLGLSSRRVLVLGVVVGLLVGGLVGGLVVGFVFPRPDTSAIDVAQQPSRVTVGVSTQPVRVVASLQGTVSAPSVVGVLPNAVNGVGVDVVSGRVCLVGDVIKPWDVVGEVSNRPVFAVLSSVPLFRDLAPDMFGSDVRLVQQALKDAGWLKSDPSGVMDWATSNALTRLFKAAGYSAPLLASAKPVLPDPLTGVAPDPVRRAGLPLADTAWIPAGGLPVAAVAAVGQVLDADHPLLQLTTQPAVIKARADLLAAPSFQVGAGVNVQIGSGAPVSSTVLTVSGFDSGVSGGGSPGYDVTVGLPDGVDAVQAQALPVQVTETVQPATGLAVPLLAIRTDGQGSFVYRAAADETSADVRVGVTVLAQANGYAILVDNQQLPVGVQVVISGERT